MKLVNVIFIILVATIVVISIDATLAEPLRITGLRANGDNLVLTHNSDIPVDVWIKETGQPWRLVASNVADKVWTTRPTNWTGFYKLSESAIEESPAGEVGPDEASNSDKASAELPESVTRSIAFESLAEQDSSGTVTFGNEPPATSAGAPGLPRQRIRLLLPPQADIGNVIASLSNADIQDLDGDWQVDPSPPAGSSEDGEFVWPADSLITDGKDMSIYAVDEFYPASHVGAVRSGRLRQWRIVDIDLYPYRYNPVTRKLLHLRNADISLAYQLHAVSRRDAKLNQSKNQKKFATRLRTRTAELVSNFEAESAAYESMPDEEPAPQDATSGEVEDPPEAAGAVADYVIITTTAISNQSSQLSAFISHKVSLGFTIRVVTEAASADASHYDQGSTCDSRANNIRSWLVSNYSSLGIEYVLLVGNPHSTSFNSSYSIPMKICYPKVATVAPTDMYFAELSGNWDKNGNGQYGELADMGGGGFDMSCEIAVGRIPVYDTGVTQIGYLDSILTKTISYESSSDTTWRKNFLGSAGFQDDGHNVDGAEMIEAFKNNVCVPAGWSSLRLYQQGTKISTCNSSYSSDYELRGKFYGGDSNHHDYHWSQNDYGVVMWWGHGSSLSTVVGPNNAADGSLFRNSYASSLDNSHPSFLFPVSCNNGYPEVTDNLCVSVLRNGGIGALSPSRVTWYAGTTWRTSLFGSYSDNASYNYNVARRMIDYTNTIGEAVNWVHENGGLGWSSGSSLMNHFDFNIYGDPSVDLAQSTMTFSSVPDTRSITLSWTDPQSVCSTSSTVFVRWSTNGLPAATNSGTLVYSGTNTSLEHIIPRHGITNYYSLWLNNYAEVPCGVDKYTSGVSTSAPLSSFTALALTNNVYLRWAGTLDAGFTNPAVFIRWSTNSHPATQSDGTEVYAGTNTVFEHSGLSEDITNYYTIWATENDGSSYGTIAGNNETEGMTDSGRLKLFFHNQTSGLVAFWGLRNNGLRKNNGLCSATAVNSSWALSATSDINNDGIADLVFHNQSSGLVAYWALGPDCSKESNGLVSDVAVNASWSLAGAVDADSNGAADLFFHNQSSGLVAYWLLNTDCTRMTNGLVYSTPVAASWRLAAVTSADPSGTGVLYFHNQTSGLVAYWVLNSDGTLKSNGLVSGSAVSPSWRLSGAGDLDGDGTCDLIFHNQSSGLVAYWLLNYSDPAVSRKGNGLVSAVAVNADWQLNAIRDLDNDDTADLVFHNQGSGLVAYWILNVDQGNVTKKSNGLASSSAVNTSWVLSGNGH